MADEATDAPSDDIKRRFKEALDRKNADKGSGESHADSEGGKAHEAHGPAKSQRTFRRKSGG